MKKLNITYNQNGSYTVNMGKWTITGDLMFLSEVFDMCYTKGLFVKKLKEYIDNE